MVLFDAISVEKFISGAADVRLALGEDLESLSLDLFSNIFF